jgi:hypothetical protein
MGYGSQSAVLKREIEAKLASRIPAALSLQALQTPRLMTSCVPEIDGLFGGGLPIGGVTEFTGLSSSGRTSLAFSLLAGATTDSVCASIDVGDTLDPKCAAASGVNHKNLLWVRVANMIPRVALATSLPSPISVIGQTQAGRMVGGKALTQTVAPRAALRSFRPAQQAKVVYRDAVPSILFWRGERLELGTVSGPWQSSGYWWDGRRWEADEWDAVVSQPLQALRLRHEPQAESGTWRVSMTDGYIELHGRSAFSFLEGHPGRRRWRNRRRAWACLRLESWTGMDFTEHLACT